MADGGGLALPQEEPSVALDRLFLELHEHLPKAAREKFAQLADEVKCLTQTSSAEAPVAPQSSAEQAVVRRDEEIATINAKQSSGELQARGAVVTSLSDQPTLKDVVCIAVPRVAPKWYDLGLALDIQPFVLDGVTHEQEKADRPRVMFAKWLEASPDTGSQPRTWQTVLDAVRTICGLAAMEDIRTAVQTPQIPSEEPTRKRHRSSTQSSENLEPQQSVAKKSLSDHTALKMDLLAQDISDLHSESDPEVIIKLLYSNALATISDLLEPHLKAVKKAAGRFHHLGLHHASAGEGIIESANSVDSLLRQMSVAGKWDQTRFLRKAIASIPYSAPERSIAEAILSHYQLHLAIYERTTLLKEALKKESESKEEVEASLGANKLVPLKITSPKAFDNFSCEDCYILQVRGLGAAYGIPEETIICRDVEECQSTTVTFLIPCQYVYNVIQCHGRLDTVWLLLELDIIEVSIPGVFTFIPTVSCFLSLLRESKTFTADLLGVTEVLPYQTYSLLDPDIKEPLSGQPLSTKRIEQHWDSHVNLVPYPQCSVLESGGVDNLAAQSEEAVIPPEGSNVGATDELQSKVGELEDKVKDLEQKVTNLFMDNVALKTKLEASREVERQQQQEITYLKERLVQALRPQGTATQEQSLSRTRESQLEEKVKALEKMRFDLEAELEKLVKLMKQLEILPSDIEQLVKSELTTPMQQEERPDKVAGHPPVVEAARLGQLSTVRKLLDEGTATVDDRDEEGKTALLWASYEGHLPVVRELMNMYKVDVFQKDKDDHNAMHAAAEGGHLNVIKFLSPMFGARVHEKTRDACTMLHRAAYEGHYQVARYLMENLKLDPQDRDEWGCTALLRAAEGGSVPLMKILLEDYGSSLDEVDKGGLNAMHAAAAGGSLDVIKFLLPMFGARIHEKTKDSSSMLHWAAQEGHYQVACYLIEVVKLDPQDKDKDGHNALHIAAANGHLDVVKYFIPIFGQHRFDKDNAGRTCLDLAVEEERHYVVEYLQLEGGFSDRQ